MQAVEIACVDPTLMLVDPKLLTIPVGTIAVIPHVDPEAREEDEFRANNEEGYIRSYPIPEGTILLAGQILSREMYEELSPLYPDGGFYNFPLPNLIKKFIIGINVENNELIWGDGVIYFKSIPEPVKVQRDIRY